jgi:hypothetical protein
VEFSLFSCPGIVALKRRMKKVTGNKSAWLLEGIDPYVLFFFRILYGLFMVYEMIDYFRIGLIRNMFFLPVTNFKYDYLKWLEPLPETWMNGLLAVLVICSLCITLGLFFKWACRIFAIGYAYLFLLDKGLYNNHIYLFILLAVLLSFTDADKGLSLKNRKPLAIPFQIPRWQVFILQVQIMIVYFYGGIAKLTYDWLALCQPVRFLLDTLPPEHFLTALLKNEVAVYVLNYGGLLIDLLAPLLLWYKPVRKWGVFPFIIFHATNSRIFNDIGIFPYLMLCGLILYYTTDELPFGKKLKSWFAGRSGITSDKHSTPQRFIPSFAFTYIVGPYFVFQLLFPFRGHFLPNNLDWTTIGNRFSWRMKVDTRQIEEIQFTAFEPTTNKSYPIDIRTRVNDMQILNMSMDPRSVADFARHLKKEALDFGMQEPQIKASIKLIYNRRPAQYFVNPQVDLSEVTYSPFKKLNWVIPLKK